MGKVKKSSASGSSGGKKSKSLVASLYKQFGYGAVKTQLTDQPKQSFRYTGLTVKREWPIRVECTQKLAPVGGTRVIGPGASLHYSAIVPANQCWRWARKYFFCDLERDKRVFSSLSGSATSPSPESWG